MRIKAALDREVDHLTIEEVELDPPKDTAWCACARRGSATLGYIHIDCARTSPLIP